MRRHLNFIERQLNTDAGVTFIVNELLGFTLAFIGFIFILLVTVRNRYMPLIGCAIAVFGVEGFLLARLRHQLSGYVLAYIIGLLFVDALILYFLWQFLYSSHHLENNGTQKLAESENGQPSFFVGSLIYASTVIETIIMTKWFRLFLGLLFIFLCITSCARSCRTFPDG